MVFQYTPLISQTARFLVLRVQVLRRSQRRALLEIRIRKSKIILDK